MEYRSLFAVLLVSLFAAVPASAITYNFARLADDILTSTGMERNWSDVSAAGGVSTWGSFTGQSFIKSGVGLTATGRNGNGTFSDAFLDSSTRYGPAGLGVCSTSPSNGLKSGCASGWGSAPADDNVSGSRGGETLSLTFTERVTFSKITFRDSIHKALASGSIRVAGNDIAILNGEFADPDDFALLAGLRTIDFAYTGDQFYISKIIVAPIPLPAALPLLLAGLAGLGYTSYRRKRTTA